MFFNRMNNFFADEDHCQKQGIDKSCCHNVNYILS